MKNYHFLYIVFFNIVKGRNVCSVLKIALNSQTFIGKKKSYKNKKKNQCFQIVYKLKFYFQT